MVWFVDEMLIGPIELDLDKLYKKSTVEKSSAVFDDDDDDRESGA